MDSGIFSLDENRTNYSSSEDFDEEEESLSDSPSNTSDDSDEVIGNWERRKRVHGNVHVHVNPKKARYPSSPANGDSDKKENDPPRYPDSCSDADSDEKENERPRYPGSCSDADSYEKENDPPRYPSSPSNADSDKKENDPPRYPGSCSNADSDEKENERPRYPSSCSDEKENDPPGNDVKPLYSVSFPYNYPNLPIQACESSGQETIYNFVRRIFQQPGNKRRKPHLEKMVFFNSNGECLNVGLPVGVLSTEETYECHFKGKKLSFDPSDLRRQFAEGDYNKNWKLGYFQVLCSERKIAPGVSEFSKISVNKMKIHFFNDETIFVALVRDNRFKEEKLRSCGATFDQSQTPLSSKAVNIHGKDIKIVPLNEKDSKLPESVSPRPHPKLSKTAASIKPKQQEHASAACSATCVTPRPVGWSTPVTARGSPKTRYNSPRLVEITFDIKRETFTLGKNARELVQLREKLENFALKEGCSCYVCEQEELIEIAQSVGAIFKLDHADHAHLVGTCFMIGAGCIITNKHVEKEISKTAKGRCYVNFHFKKNGQEDLQRFFIDRLMICSWELDYAILRMENPHEQLPPSIFSHGVRIMNPTCPESNWSLLDDMRLRLIGHPRGEPKQIDLMCTINASPQSGLECWCYTLRRGNNLRRGILSPSLEAEAAKD